jgi:lysozyme
MLDATYLDAIKQFEGYAAEARWDYAQNTNGYGTRAHFAGEVIDKAEADKRFADEIAKAADFVEKFAPGLDAGSKAALTSLTYNAGTAWAQSGLGQAVESGDLDKARSIFLQYNKAGGSVLDGLVQRRLQEVAWFGGGNPVGQVVGAGVESAAASATASADLCPVSGYATLLSQPAIPSSFVSPATAIFGSEAKSSATPFAGLAGDPVLLSLLSQLTKSHLMGSADGQSREPQAPADNQAQTLAV